MTRLIKIFFGLSNTTLATMLFVILLIQFLYSAMRAAEIEYAQQRMEKLTQLSFQQLGEVRANGKASS